MDEEPKGDALAKGFVEGVSEKGFAQGSSETRVSHLGRAGAVDWERRLAKDASSSIGVVPHAGRR